jgi:Type I phosphodiesterase / nucleotide pyrophosphatase
MTEERPRVASVDEVREELKRLGYLDSGLDRFVLGAAGGTSAVRASLGAALRVGLVGGVMFGLGLTLMAVGLDRRLLAEPTDLAVLALYLALALGALTAFAAFLGGLAAAWVGRRLGRRPGPTLAHNVGLGVGLAGLVVLALWWRSHLAGASGWAQATALALGLGLCLALGRFGSLAAVAVLSAGGALEGLPRAGFSRRHVVPLLASAAALFGGGVAAASYFGQAVGGAGPDYAVVSTGLRVRVLGIDGLERRMTEQMVARGQMPHLQELLGRGAHGRLRAEPERVPAIVWTTIATGRGPEAHGIVSTGARRLAGMKTPVAIDAEERPFVSALGRAADLLRLTRTQPPSGVLRGAKTFWNVASEKGLRVGVLNWWATWPADAVNGYVVSDRAFFKLEKGGPPEREVHPPDAFGRLRPLLATKADDRARALDLFHAAAARELRGMEPPDVEALYLSGLDIFTMQQLGEAAVADLASLDARLDAVRAYYRFVDERIGEAEAGRGPGDVLILVGDPGRLARGAPGAAEGTLVIVGGPVKAIDLGLVSSRDVAPTALHLAGLPASRELDGKVLEAAFDPSFASAHPVRFVSSYGRRPALPSAESAFDQAMVDELKSLGYLQ